GTVLVHPDGLQGHIIRSRTWTTSGSIEAGSRILELDQAHEQLLEGAVVAIHSAGGPSETATTTLAEGLGRSGTTLRLVEQASLWQNGPNWLQVGDEIVQYGASQDGVFQGLRRGHFGTDVSEHAAGTPVAQSLVLYARVERVEGLQV